MVERNRLIERVQEITSHVDEDVREFIGRVGAAEYQRRTLADEIRDRGPGYAGYHRLKVRAVTDDLAAMLGQPSRVVDAWRRTHYSEQDPERSESLFLLEYDLGYRERRMQYLLRKLTDPGVKQKLNRIAATLKSLRRPDAKADVATAEAIADRFREVFIRAAADAEACLDPDSRRIFDQFEYYDQIVFPIFYEASVGEAELCEVFRISPRDATSIVDENAPAEKRRETGGHRAVSLRSVLEPRMAGERPDVGAPRRRRTNHPSRLAGFAGSERSLIHEANLAIVGSEEALTRLRETYEVNRKLPVFTRLKLGFAASRIILKMLAGYLIRRRQ